MDGVSCGICGQNLAHGPHVACQECAEMPCVWTVLQREGGRNSGMLHKYNLFTASSRPFCAAQGKGAAKELVKCVRCSFCINLPFSQ